VHGRVRCGRQPRQTDPGRVRQEGILDTRNFDKEFTNMPAQLTPENDSVEGLKKDFEQFTFYMSNNAA
jgi:hypothetical protein